MFDTHCHLNFKAFKKNVKEVIDRANYHGVNYFLIPGTDISSSQRAIEITTEYQQVYAAVGIHPHHVYNYLARENNGGPSSQELLQADLQKLAKLAQNPKCVAIGEVGLDSHLYQNTKYSQYAVTNQFLELQKQLLPLLIKLTLTNDKSLIIHNRQTTSELLAIINQHWDEHLRGRLVFHCCEPKNELRDFAASHKVFMGIDGDITYLSEKQAFVKELPLELIVVETDSPYLLPEPLRQKKLYPNEPKNLHLIVEKIAQIKSEPVNVVEEITTANGKHLFNLTD